MNSILQLHHLFRRATFGLSLRDFEKAESKSPQQALDRIFRDSESFRPIQLIKFKPQTVNRKELSKEERKALRKAERQELRELNLHWFRRMVESPQQLRERMTLFWHGHFACRIDHPAAMQHLNNVHREFGMGDFRSLLLEVSKSPAMLQFLNNRQNKKRQANENFARELMELFTLGRGNYTEKDIREAARAFTGWNFDREGNFQIRQRQHDTGQKEFFGKRGNFGGEEIIDIILKQRRCADFLAEKLYNYFVSPDPNAEQIKAISDRLWATDYHIGKTMRFIFSSDWFYGEKISGAKIKSPIEFLVGLFRTYEVEGDSKELVKIQQALGQVLFKPPNVAGWPGDKAWIDSSTLLRRLKLPGILLGLDQPNMRLQGEFEEGFDQWQKRLLRKLNLEVPWKKLMKAVPADAPEQYLSDRLLGHPFPADELQALSQLRRSEYGPQLLKTVTSLPEYQFC